MTTIEARIPEPVLKQAKELAERENMPLEQLISLAVAQAHKNQQTLPKIFDNGIVDGLVNTMQSTQ